MEPGTIDIPHPSSIDIGTHQRQLIQRGELKTAERDLRRWLTQNPSAKEAPIRQLELGRVLFWQGKPLEAKRELEDVLDTKPDETWALSFLGQVEVRLGNFQKAKRLFEEALALNPDNHEATTFLHGNTLEQAADARRWLTHRKLTPEGRTRFGELCLAIDFKMGKRVDLEDGIMSQQSLDRMNLMLDYAEVGEEVDAETSLRPAFDSANRVVFYGAEPFGDTILGLSAIDAMAKYFELHPEKQKPIEIVTTYPDVFDSLSEKYPFVKVKSIVKEQGKTTAELYVDDLKQRQEKVFVLTNGDDKIYHPLRNARTENTTALVHAYVNRFALDLHPWQSPIPPYDQITSYPARMYRFTEMLLGEKLSANPARQELTLPISERITHDSATMARKYGIAKNTDVHTIVESASQISKKFSPDQLRELLIEMAKSCAEQQRTTKKDARIIFIKDPAAPTSFADQIARLPEETRRYITVAEESLKNVQGILALSSSVIAPDTGIAHLAGAMKKNVLILYTMADPYLWTTGGENIGFLASRQALTAHENLTPVNMIQWSDNLAITQQAFTVEQIMEKWKSLTPPRVAPKRSFSFLSLNSLRRSA